MDSRRGDQPRWQVVWPCYYPQGATRALGEKVYYIHAANEREAKASARDMMRNAGLEEVGPPRIVKVHD